MQKTLITGFTPFDGRNINASWVAASSISRKDIDIVEIPVIWDEPMKVLQRYCKRQCPQTIISLGEGREGWFDIETVALNAREERPDNEGKLPEGKPVSKHGPDSRIASINASIFQRGLAESGYPTRISSDAGQFLCEETLYVLLHLKEDHPQLDHVLFCHVPPHGSIITINGVRRKCEESLLNRFTQRLIDIMQRITHPGSS